jgi:hypothetical protein
MPIGETWEFAGAAGTKAVRARGLTSASRRKRAGHCVDVGLPAQFFCNWCGVSSPAVAQPIVESTTFGCPAL